MIESEDRLALIEQCIAANNPCVLEVSDGERVEFPGLAEMIVRETFAEIRRQRFVMFSPGEMAEFLRDAAKAERDAGYDRD